MEVIDSNNTEYEVDIVKSRKTLSGWANIVRITGDRPVDRKRRERAEKRQEKGLKPIRKHRDI
jgi:hypothetical protein